MSDPIGYRIGGKIYHPADVTIIRPADHIEQRGDALEEAASALLAAMRELAAVKPAALDPRAVFLAMSRALKSVHETALELARQEWVTPSDDPDAAERWQAQITGLGTAADFFEEVANGWI